MNHDFVLEAVEHFLEGQLYMADCDLVNMIEWLYFVLLTIYC